MKPSRLLALLRQYKAWALGDHSGRYARRKLCHVVRRLVLDVPLRAILVDDECVKAAGLCSSLVQRLGRGPGVPTAGSAKAAGCDSLCAPFFLGASRSIHRAPRAPSDQAGRPQEQDRISQSVETYSLMSNLETNLFSLTGYDWL